jgi:MoaA/NifB/PqqE/SkfB family radical SAM enzyme
VTGQLVQLSNGLLRSVHLQSTTNCNAMCPTCNVTRYPCVGADMSWDTLSAVPEAYEYALGGGEPTTREDINEVIRYLRSRKHCRHVGLTTNGMVTRRVEADRVAVSIDGITEEVHRETHSTPLVTVERALEYYTSYVPTVVNHIVTSSNVLGTAAFLDRFPGYWVNLIIFKPSTRGSRRLMPTLGQLRDLVPVVEYYKDKLLLDGCLATILTHYCGMKYPKCQQGSCSKYVNVDGTVQPCSNSTTTDPCKLLLEYGDHFLSTTLDRVVQYSDSGDSGAHVVAYRLGYKGRILHHASPFRASHLHILEAARLPNKGYTLFTTRKTGNIAWVDTAKEIE